MKPGDVVHVRRIDALLRGTRVTGTMGFKAPKGGSLVVMYLGAEDPATEFDPILMLYELGWTCPEFPDPRALPPASPTDLPITTESIPPNERIDP